MRRREARRYTLEVAGGARSRSARCRSAIRTRCCSVESVESAPVERLGPAHRAPSALSAAGERRLHGDRRRAAHIRLRVYERGAGETLACGTGACAAVAVGRRRGLLDSEVRVRVRGGELRVNWEGAGRAHLADRAGARSPSKDTSRFARAAHDDKRGSRLARRGYRGGDRSPATCSTTPTSSNATRQLLARLRLPHARGGSTISLVERQVEVLREKHAALEAEAGGVRARGARQRRHGREAPSLHAPAAARSAARQTPSRRSKPACARTSTPSTRCWC